jgi:DNA mismatch repair protein MutS
MCIWLESFNPYANNNTKKKQLLVCGASVLNVFTGELYTFQNETTLYMNITTFDELERFVSMYNPSEVIIIHDFAKDDLSKIVNYAGIRTDNIHMIESSATKCERCKNQKYMKELISRVYNEDAFDTYADFTQYVMATQSLCYLLHFIQEHNPDIIKKLKMPSFNNVSDNIILANHTLTQLNIISDNSFDSQVIGKKSSVMSFLNKCCTPMGKRMFQYQITHPTVNVKWLNTEYDTIDGILKNCKQTDVALWRKELNKVKDIDKILRQMLLKVLYPSSIYNLYETVIVLNKLCDDIHPKPFLYNYIAGVNEGGDKLITKHTLSIRKYLNKHFVISDCKALNSMTVFPVNIIKKGINNELDILSDKYTNLLAVLTSLQNGLNKFIRTYENTSLDYIKIHETEKSGLSLQMTVKRSNILTKIIKTNPKAEFDVLHNGIKNTILAKDIKFIKSSASNVDINFRVSQLSMDIHEICRSILICKNNLNVVISETYVSILIDMESTVFQDIESTSKILSTFDVILSKTYCAKEYKYVKPIIDESPAKSYVDAKGLRHCLIEQIQDTEIYVENDIELGRNNNDGLLLYGTNAVGKTSMIRALGISVIMAQCGMFVPCSHFCYKPYTAIFTRILGNDNLFKGLSTFAVEMSELRTILNLSNENSLVLGDELCSGTETESALSIFIAGLQHLYKNTTSFIFATHFHEIVEYEEIVNMSSLSLKHLAVSYDPENECLVYDRKLKDGSGPRIYGLEVCKSLYMNVEFLDAAFEIRNKYFSNTRGVLSNTPSSYNASKVKGLCELCNKTMGTEVHHLQQQKDADDNGFIGGFHKNHKANLVSICETCHDNIHNADNENDIPIKKKKTTKGMKLY